MWRGATCVRGTKIEQNHQQESVMISRLSYLRDALNIRVDKENLMEFLLD